MPENADILSDLSDAQQQVLCSYYEMCGENQVDLYCYGPTNIEGHYRRSLNLQG